MTGMQQGIVIAVALVTGFLATQALEAMEPMESTAALEICTPSPCVATRG